MVGLLSVDAHAAGGPCRVVHTGVPPLKGINAPARRAHFRREMDWIRTALMHEPRGHAGEFGAVLVPPVRETSTYSLIFFDPAGYLDGCGHGTICSVAVWQRLMGEVKAPFEIDNPDGSVTTVLAVTGDNEGCSATLQLPPARVLRERVEVPWDGGITAALVRCSNPYVVVEATELRDREEDAFGPIEARKRILGEVLLAVEQKIDRDRSVVPEVLIYRTRDGMNAFETSVLYNATQIDRSPCGTGSGALATLLSSRNQIQAGASIMTYGPRDLAFEVVAGPISGAGECQVQLKGTAHITGIHEWVIGANDPLRTGSEEIGVSEGRTVDFPSVALWRER